MVITTGKIKAGHSYASTLLLALISTEVCSHLVTSQIPRALTRTNKEVLPPVLFLDHIEKSVAWGQVAFFNQLSAWEMRGRQGLQDLSLAGSGSVISRLLITFWKEEEILETTKLLSALIWPTAHNSCKS